jgi:hypothetical protein
MIDSDTDADAVADADSDEPKTKSLPLNLRPILLAGAFVAVATILEMFSVSISTWATNPFPVYLVRELEFCLRIAFVFWLCFRTVHASAIERVAGWSLFVGWITIEETSSPWYSAFAQYQSWSDLYRILLFFLVFRLLHQGLGLSILAKGQRPKLVQLKMWTLLTSMAMFALLFVIDSAIREWAASRDRISLQSDPPLLALVASVTRALLWVGMALLMSHPKRSSTLLGLGMIGLWALSRTGVVIYLVQVLYPSQQQDNRWNGSSSVDWQTLAILQADQFLFVVATLLAIRLAGYQFYRGKQTERRPKAESIRFDDLQ